MRVIEIRKRINAEQQIEVASLAGQQRPSTAYAGAVEWAAVFVLTIPVFVIAMITAWIRGR